MNIDSLGVLGTLLLMAGILAKPALAQEAAKHAPVVWCEGEKFSSAPKDLAKPAQPKDAASGGMVLFGSCLDRKGNVVTYDVPLPADVPGARIVFRYGRLHWRQTMVPAPVTVEVAGKGGTVRREVEFPDTGGWGETPGEYGLLAVELGDLKKGKLAVKLTSKADDNSVTLDGFFILPAAVSVTAEELNSLLRLAVTSAGYVGLRSCSPVLDQGKTPDVGIGIRSFSGEGAAPVVTLAKAGGKPRALNPRDGMDENEAGGRTLFYRLPPRTADGVYTLTITARDPVCTVKVPVTLTGEFLSGAVGRIAAIEEFTAAIGKDGGAARTRCLADFQHALELLKSGTETLAALAVAAEPISWRGRKGPDTRVVRNAAALVVRARRAAEQSEETMARLKAGKDPYAGRSGDFRRSFRSAASGDLNVYRVYVPKAYAKAAETPFILMLHGGGGDENQLSEIENGKLKAIAAERGYVLAFPRYQSRTPTFLADLKQLVDLLKAEYPKLDPTRVYATGVSMGGFSSFAMARTYPETFAAVCCVSGSGNPAQAEQVKDVPVMLIHGGLDTVVLPKNAEDMAARLKALGYVHLLRIFPQNGHDYKSYYLTLAMDFFAKYKKSAMK